MTERENIQRLRVLAAFIRSQAWRANAPPHKPGPGDVHLNQEEALLAADAIDRLIAHLEGDVP